VLQNQIPGTKTSAYRVLTLSCCLPFLLLSCGELYSDLEVPTTIVGTAIFNPVSASITSDQLVDGTIYGLPDGVNLEYWYNNTEKEDGPLKLERQADTSCSTWTTYNQQSNPKEEAPAPEFDENGNAKYCFLLKVAQSAPVGEFEIFITFFSDDGEGVYARGPLFVVEKNQ